MVQPTTGAQTASKVSALAHRIGFLTDVGRIAGLLAVTFVAAMFVYTVVPFSATVPSNIGVIPQESQPETGYIAVDCARALVQCLGATLIDVRSDGEFAQGHIVGAMHMTVREALHEPATRQDVEEWAAQAPVIFYCGAVCGDSNNVVGQLTRDGVQNVFALSGGYEGWEWAGLPTEKGPVPNDSLTED